MLLQNFWLESDSSTFLYFFLSHHLKLSEIIVEYSKEIIYSTKYISEIATTKTITIEKKIEDLMLDIEESNKDTQDGRRETEGKTTSRKW